MVAEAVAELKGEPIREPAEIKLDLPVDAHLPPAYVEREDLRLEAYRRLAEVRDRGRGRRHRARSGLDRYGPLPAAGRGAARRSARLRAECVRTRPARGDRRRSARPGAGGPGRTRRAVARLSPIMLRASARVRLSDSHPRAIYKEEIDQLIVPLPSGAGSRRPARRAARPSSSRPTRSAADRSGRGRRRRGRGGRGWIRPPPHPYDLRTCSRLPATWPAVAALVVCARAFGVRRPFHALCRRR